MDQEFDVSRDVYLDRDRQGTVLQLRHLGAPFVTTSSTPQLAASDYLHSFADLLEIAPSQLDNLGQSPATTPQKAPVEFRYLGEKSQFDTTTVAYHQTVLGLPVFQAGVAVQMKTGPFRVISSQSTRHPDVKVSKPNADALKRAESLTNNQLGQALGLAARDGGDRQPLRKSLEIQDRSLIVYQYDPDKVQRGEPSIVLERDVEHANGHVTDHDLGSLPLLPLPPVPDSFRSGEHYVCVKIDFALALPAAGTLNWTAILDVDTLAVLYVRPHVDDVTGLVFDIDPTTANGPGPSATSTALNPFRVSETLLGLNAPSGGTQSLTGDTVALIDSESPTVAAPTKPAGSNFDYDSRTNDFSAVNAYVHCDRFFRVVDSMGFTRSGYFPGTTFPTSVDFRGFDTVPPPNAHCVGLPGGTGIARTTFALADGGDTAHPIGLADDLRVVLHELGGHGVLYNHVHSANFGFSHSAGDSVAAILCDAGSLAPDRFQTFPWVASVISRRHDRLPSGGWGWAGNIALHPFSSTYDGGGYNNEQILSSTMFRIYRSLGGDSADLNTKRFAARMTVYLILRAIGTLTPATNPSTASGFETALETADAGDWTSENLTGGAYRKVIRWSFEKQGMFQPSGTATPNNNAGAPPAVDVYINDGRNGEYNYQPVFWENQNIWNRLAADGGTTHQDPITNRTNYGYVKIKNRGTQTATNVVVKAFHANPAAGLSYPNDWIPMTTAQLTAANVSPNSAGEITVGPFAWTPTHVGHECMFVIVSATGDESNVSHIAAGDSIPEWRLVPNDNNIGQRNVAPVPGGTTGLTAEFSDLTFEMKNPLTTTAVMQIEHTLPSLLAERGWELQFTNRGGAAFKLAPQESREITMHLVPGKEFGPADVEAVADRTILVAARADGILVGGMSYRLDPSITKPNRPGGSHNPAPGEPGHEHDAHCGCHGDPKLDHLAEILVRSLEKRQPHVRNVEIKKVVVEIELEEECD
jgi:zinc metalloprotease ZmpB